MNLYLRAILFCAFIGVIDYSTTPGHSDWHEDRQQKP
jgi:hypothetical protein